MRSSMEVEIAALSRCGGRTRNEDTCGWWSGPGVAFCVVSDGAGGHRAGDVASKLVVEETLGVLRSTQECSVESIAAALRHANERLVTRQRSEETLCDMRATAVVLALDPVGGAAAWGHLGDSRLYCFRNNRVAVRTRDHSVVQSMVDAGLLDDDAARLSPQRNQLLSAMGEAGLFEPCLDGSAFSLELEDKFLLCTDGLWDPVNENEMEGALEHCVSAEEWLRELESYVIAKDNPRQDNYSAIAAWCRRGLT
jgi:serine/threonine protein phosphatase PrpC